MKQGLDWFKLETRSDSRLQLLEAEFGLKAFAVVVKLHQKIFGELGYYCEWNKEVALLFSRKECGEGCGVVSEIVLAAVKRGIFDKELFEKYHILTSVEIQKLYFEAVTRRKSSEIKSEYLLVKLAKNSDIADISSENACNFQKNVDIFSQRRKEKRRVDKTLSKERESEKVLELFNDACASFPHASKMTERRKKEIAKTLGTFSMEDFKHAFEKAEKSDFLKGKNEKEWQATFDWMINETNLAKILEGSFDNKAPSTFSVDDFFEKALAKSYQAMADGKAGQGGLKKGE